jgi:hypothetical protein
VLVETVLQREDWFGMLFYSEAVQFLQIAEHMLILNFKHLSLLPYELLKRYAIASGDNVIYMIAYRMRPASVTEYISVNDFLQILIANSSDLIRGPQDIHDSEEISCYSNWAEKHCVHSDVLNIKRAIESEIDMINIKCSDICTFCHPIFPDKDAVMNE